MLRTVCALVRGRMDLGGIRWSEGIVAGYQPLAITFNCKPRYFIDCSGEGQSRKEQ